MAICGFYLREFPSLVFLHGYSERSTLTEGERADGRRKEETEKKPMVVQIRNPGVRRGVLRLRLYGGPVRMRAARRWQRAEKYMSMYQGPLM